MPELLTTEEVAELLRLAPRTVRNLAKAGRLPAVTISRCLRFRRRDIERAMRPVPRDLVKSR